MAPAGAEHGDVAGQVFYLIRSYLEDHPLGKVYAAETGFTIARNPDTIRAPDVAFVRQDRVPRTPRRGFFDGPPDLAVEVVSPSDRHSDINAKVDQWLTAGATSVWVVDPPNRSIVVHRAGGQLLRYQGDQELRDEPTLPGFILKLADLFAADQGNS